MSDGFRWNEWNLEHIGTHGVSPSEAEYIVDHAQSPYPEPVGDGKWRVRGQSATGRYLQVILVFDPDDTAYIIHARGLNDQEKAPTAPETAMKKKPFWEMNAEELAEATKAFDDPTYEPAGVKATPAERAQMRRWQRKRAAARLRLSLSLDKGLVEETDHYAVSRGITFADVVSDALRRLMHKKSA